MENRSCKICKYRPEGIICKLFGTIDNSKLFERGCVHFAPIKITNGDKIRTLNDEELAELFIDLYDGNRCKYCAYMKSGMCSLKPRHEEYDEGGWVEDEDCIRGMIEYLKKEVKDE